MLRIIAILALFGGCWLPPHIPDPIPRNRESMVYLDETRNLCVDTAEQAPDLPVLSADHDYHHQYQLSGE